MSSPSSLLHLLLVFHSSLSSSLARLSFFSPSSLARLSFISSSPPAHLSRSSPPLLACMQVVGPSSDLPGLFPAALNGLTIADVTPSMRAALLDAAARLRLSLVLRTLQRLHAVTLELGGASDGTGLLPSHSPTGDAFPSYGSNGSDGGGNRRQQTVLIYALSTSLMIQHPSSLRPGLLPPSSLPPPTPSLAAGQVTPAVRRSVDASAGVVSLCFSATSAEGLALFWAALHRAATACDPQVMRRMRPGHSVPEVIGGRGREGGRARATIGCGNGVERIGKEGSFRSEGADGLLWMSVVSPQVG